MAEWRKLTFSDQERRLNRQINFLIMRKMWQTIRGRAKKGSEDQTIYVAFHMSRERYTRIIRGEAVRFSKGELERLMRESGVLSDILEGITAFEFEAISLKDWQKLFELREVDIAKAREYEKYLYNQMKQSDVDLIKNPDLYHFAVYLKRWKAATDKSIEADLKNIIQQLDAFSLAHLEQCDINILREYLQGLKKQMDIASTLVRYIELKQ